MKDQPCRTAPGFYANIFGTSLLILLRLCHQWRLGFATMATWIHPCSPSLVWFLLWSHYPPNHFRPFTVLARHIRYISLSLSLLIIIYVTSYSWSSSALHQPWLDTIYIFPVLHSLVYSLWLSRIPIDYPLFSVAGHYPAIPYYRFNSAILQVYPEKNPLSLVMIPYDYPWKSIQIH